MSIHTIVTNMMVKIKTILQKKLLNQLVNVTEKIISNIFDGL